MAIRIQAVKKCGYLRQIARGQKENPVATLRDTLISAQAGKFTGNLQAGRLLVSTSGNGQSGSFAISSMGAEWTQDNIFGLLEEFIQLLDSVVADGDGTDGFTPEEIDALTSAMIERISAGWLPQIGVNQQMGDFSGLNFPATAIN